MISVIVPVYKVEDYLDQCVQSIVSQTYADLEIILVDDGSPDDCPAMCDAWAERDSRIKVIHKKNGGLSDARNAGMAIARGEYLAFVDSDDWIESDILRLSLQCSKENNADIVAFGVDWIYSDRKENPNPLHAAVYYGTDNIVRTYFQSCMVRTTVWNKLYKSSILNDIRFPEGRLHEDEFFTYRVLAKANVAAVIDTIGYHYRQRSDSIMGTYNLRHLDALEAMKEKAEFLSQNYADLLPRFHREQMSFCFNQYCMILKYASADPDKIGRHYIRAYIRKIGLSIKDLKGASWKEMLRYIAVFFSVDLAALLYMRFFHIGQGE